MFVEHFFEDYVKEQYGRRAFSEPNVVHVSELVQCRKKSILANKFPEVITVEPRMFLGKVVHRGIQEWFKEKYNAKIEAEGDKAILDVIITGHADVLTDDFVVEVKYARDVYQNQPYDHHISQVKTYMWLFERELGWLLYITPERMVEFQLRGAPKDDEIMMLYDTWSSPRYPWECDYCQFSKICSQAVVSKKR